MAIQFCCTNCGQPIEVDDLHAGRAAACPYCQHVVDVPAGSTYDPQQPSAAPPSPTPPLDIAPLPTSASPAPAYPPPPYLPRNDYDDPRRTRRLLAVRFGRWAWSCTLVVVLVALAIMIYNLWVARQVISTSSQPADFQVAMHDAQNLPGAQIASAAMLFSVLLAVVGVALSIVSLIQNRAGNWRGWVSLIVCALFLLFVCMLLLISFALLAGHAPA